MRELQLLLLAVLWAGGLVQPASEVDELPEVAGQCSDPSLRQPGSNLYELCLCLEVGQPVPVLCSAGLQGQGPPHSLWGARLHRPAQCARHP